MLAPYGETPIFKVIFPTSANWMVHGSEKH